MQWESGAEATAYTKLLIITCCLMENQAVAPSLASRSHSHKVVAPPRGRHVLAHMQAVPGQAWPASKTTGVPIAIKGVTTHACVS
jgi:hypothetical protein